MSDLREDRGETGWTVEWWPPQVATCARCESPVITSDGGLHATCRDPDARPYVLCDDCADRADPYEFQRLIASREAQGSR